MRRHILPILTLAGLALAGRADAQTPAAEPEPTRIIIECEDMQGVDQQNFGPGKQWRVGRWGEDLYQNMIFGGVWASRLRVAMTDAGGEKAEAYQDIDVPADGTYKVWAKYECPPFFNYAFGIRIAPLADKKDAVFEKTYGLRESPKHYCFNNDLVAGDLYWSWGMDHDAAEGYDVTLPKGRYRVTMFKTANPAPAAARSVDTIMITSDLSKLSAPRMPRYPLLDELRRANKVYFRIRNLSKTGQAAKIAWNHWNHRYPDFYQPFARDKVKFYDAAGNPLPSNSTGDWKDPIPAGGLSIWADLGSTMNTESSSPFQIKALPVDAPRLDITTGPCVPFAVDIALSPSERGIVKTITLGAGETELNLLVQPDLHHAEGVKTTLNMSDVYRDIIQQLNKERRLGPVPRKMMLFAGTAAPRYPSSFENGKAPWGFELDRGYRDALGLNTMGTYLMKDDVKGVLERAERVKHPIIPRSLSYHHSQSPKEIADIVKKAGVQDNFYYLSYGDEIGLNPVDVSDAKIIAKFREFVKQQGQTPESLGVASWDQVKPMNSFSGDVAVQIGVLPQGSKPTAEQTNKLKRLYWYSDRFRVHQGVESFAEKTRELKTLLGKDVESSANLGGMHPFYWMHQASFIEAFKHNAMSMAWSEDYTYCQPEASRLVVDFEASYLRKGASYNDQRMMFYCMPHYPGNSPEHLLHNAVLLWAQNVKDLDFFVASPDTWSTENYVTYRGGLPILKTIRTISGMAGLIENDLMPARPVQAPIAMLLSEASDVWEIDGLSQGAVAPATAGKPATTATNVSQEERKNIWYALRKAGYRVDFVTEDDVRDGLLKNYKALYICGQNLDRAAAKNIKEWVAAGGTAFATAGAARKDEFDEPLSELDETFGRAGQTAYQRYKGPLRAKLELLFEKPLDRVQIGTAAFDALCSKEEFSPTGEALVLGRYASNGEPALVKKASGKGNAYYTGSLPGQAYVRKGLPLVPMGKGGGDTNSSHFEPVDHDMVAQDVILSPLRDNNILPDVTINHRSVVAGRLASPASTVLPIVNLAERADGNLKNVEIVVTGVKGKPRKVWSCYFTKGLKFKQQGDRLTITLPALQTADVLVINN